MKRFSNTVCYLKYTNQSTLLGVPCEYYKCTSPMHVGEDTLAYIPGRNWYLSLDTGCEILSDTDARYFALLRVILIDNALKAKTTYNNINYKKLNMIRSFFHPDVLHQLVRLLTDIRSVHYLETAST